MSIDLIARIADGFRRFASDARDSTRLYEQLALAVADDPELIETIMIEAGDMITRQPLPNILFGAVHYLRPNDYPGIDSPENPYPAFRAFILQHQDAIRPFFKTRIVQTNEVRRCTLLLPAFATVAQKSSSQPLALIEIGASAGLNMQWDHYGYHYRDHYNNGTTYGDLESPLQLECESRGAALPIDGIPIVGYRTGIDLNPVDITDDDAVRWLQALLWYQQPDRAERMRHALKIAAQHPPRIVQGNALGLLPKVCAEVSAEMPLCIYHTFTVYQFTPDMRQQLTALIEAEAQNREHLFRLSIEWLGGKYSPEMHLAHYQDGTLLEDRLLANTDHHGRWIEWL